MNEAIKYELNLKKGLQERDKRRKEDKEGDARDEKEERNGKKGRKKLDPFKPTKLYSRKVTKVVKIVYVASILIWLLIIWGLKLYQTNFWGFFILGIPIFFYMVTFFNSSHLTQEVEDRTFAISYISIALLVVIPLVTWVDRNFYGNKWYLGRIVVAAVVLALISLIDIWVRPKWVSVVKHIKSALQTASLTLLVFALYTYYMGQHRKIGP